MEDEPTEVANLHKHISIDRLTSTSNMPRDNSECKGTETEFLRCEKEESSHSEMVLKVQEQHSKESFASFKFSDSTE